MIFKRKDCEDVCACKNMGKNTFFSKPLFEQIQTKMYWTDSWRNGMLWKKIHVLFIVPLAHNPVFMI